MDKKTIAWNFSRYAHIYDQYADAQCMVGCELLKGAGKGHCERILELGCGTGSYTLLLRNRFKDAGILAVDISHKMIELASAKLQGKGVEFIALDAEGLDLGERFDLITANACFQWFQDLGAALKIYKGMLKDGGLILFSVFGPLTFRELSYSLRNVVKNGAIAADGFMPGEKLKKMLRDNFKEAVIEEIRYEENFASLAELLNKIKYSGVRGEGHRGRFVFGRKTLGELEKIYLDKFKGIKATYQAFLCRGYR
ncbi:MAG: methyltransferase domain-containing protein [Candidatus Omnitrophota bacterium]|nr:methyltransferase domain-containing protein [Candidatus Omnitrophota bacterium]